MDDAELHIGNEESSKSYLMKLSLGALGVVYGDIGTSPLYAIRECFHKSYSLALTSDNVLGILSLFFWSLVLVVIVKYLIFVMRADNRGEGGIMALLALILPPNIGDNLPKKIFTLIVIGTIGTSLLWADGMITPAISVLSAVEGLEIATPIFKPYVIPITIAILITLFLFQKFGTGGIGAIFGPIMLCWFTVLGIMGIPWIIKSPEVLKAINPMYAIQFFTHLHWKGFLVLGAVVLCITGTEALYADMGHFGIRPIRYAWFSVVFPGLLLNYFGQGALILHQGETALQNPFYLLVNSWLLFPLVILSTIATIIASQALISGAFSLAQQAVQLGYVPRLKIVHTSHEMHGQIYIPEINYMLMIACLALVLTFRSSSNLASAYGIAVMGTMTITSILIFVVALKKWNWKIWQALLLTLFFLSIDLPFLFANVSKIFSGGWVPLVIGAVIFAMMITWKRGRMEVAKSVVERYLPVDIFLESIEHSLSEISPDTGCPELARVSGTAVFMTSDPAGASPTLLHHLKHNKVLHKQVILLTIKSELIPIVTEDKRVEINSLPLNFYQVIAHYGFMEIPDVNEIMKICVSKGLDIVPESTSYYLGRETLLTTGKTKMALWRKLLFIFLSRNSRTPTTFFNIPPNRAIELGMLIQI